MFFAGFVNVSVDGVEVRSTRASFIFFDVGGDGFEFGVVPGEDC